MARSLDVTKFNKVIDVYTRSRVPVLTKKFQVRVANAAAEQLVMRTPVVTGHTRANWRASLNAPVSGEVSGIDPGGQATVSKMDGTIRKVKPFGVVWLANGVPWIQQLENGSSTQAPQGMLSMTTAVITARLRAGRYRSGR
jgi:CO dehydrogenase/acetyl-CoA synthase gamma subunit (corrinoid Fe-S protein)